MTAEPQAPAKKLEIVPGYRTFALRSELEAGVTLDEGHVADILAILEEHSAMACYLNALTASHPEGVLSGNAIAGRLVYQQVMANEYARRVEYPERWERFAPRFRPILPKCENADPDPIYDTMARLRAAQKMTQAYLEQATANTAWGVVPVGCD
ncbi:MAG TPA: hypothetical protein VEI97_10495 [bacterium]|nr:hypothetical protein [bacterium]